MKIGVNARLLTLPFTGIGQYTKNLFAELAREDVGNRYILVVPAEVPEKVKAVFPRNVEIKVLPEKKFPSAGMRKVWWEQIDIPAFFDKENVDIAFFTYPSNPWFPDWYKKDIKTVVTVHDCIPWTDKNYRRGVLSKMYHSKTRKAVKKADIVFTVSKSSATVIEKVCNVDKNKIHPIYNDASDAYKTPLPDDFVSSILNKFGLRKREYFLYVGGYDKRKNVDILLREHAESANFPLVLAGGKLHKNSLYESFDGTADGNVVRTGFLEEEELSALYDGALAFVNLSGKEGFNITIIEAANRKTPMILSDIPVHREVAGDNALFADISSAGAVTEAMQKMSDQNVRAEFAEKSALLADRYSFKKSALKVKNMLFS